MFHVLAQFDPQWKHFCQIDFIFFLNCAQLSVSTAKTHDFSSQVEEFRDIVEDFHHGPVKA